MSIHAGIHAASLARGIHAWRTHPRLPVSVQVSAFVGSIHAIHGPSAFTLPPFFRRGSGSPKAGGARQIAVALDCVAVVSGAQGVRRVQEFPGDVAGERGSNA